MRDGLLEEERSNERGQMLSDLNIGQHKNDQHAPSLVIQRLWVIYIQGVSRL